MQINGVDGYQENTEILLGPASSISVTTIQSVTKYLLLPEEISVGSLRCPHGLMTNLYLLASVHLCFLQDNQVCIKYCARF